MQPQQSLRERILRTLWGLTMWGTWIGTLCHRFSLTSAVITVGIFAILVGLTGLITRRPYFACSLATLILLGLTLLNKAKSFFWHEALFFSDFKLFLDPSNTETVLHYPLALALFVVLLIVFLVIGVLTFRHAKFERRVRLPALLFALWGMLFTNWQLEDGQSRWLQSLPKGMNVLTNLVMSANIPYQNPADKISSTSEAFRAAQSQLPPSDIHEAAQSLTLPNIVILLQESTFNPALYQDVQGGLPTLGMFAPNDRQTEGLLRVQTYGGATWRSEFAALTGISSEEFAPAGGSVFYSAVFHLNTSLFRELKRYGYESYLLTPFNPGAYNAGSAYEAMGIDHIVQPQDYGYPAAKRSNLWTIRTADMLKYAQQILSEKGKHPKVVFALTMREHGPYHNSEPNAPHLHVAAGADAESISNYTARLLEADEGIMAFENWVKTNPERTLFVRFGDHQPAITIASGYKTTLPNALRLTHFALLDNQLKTTLNYPVFDLVYLPGLVLERLQGKPSEAFQANIDARRLLNGAFEDASDSALRDSYRAYLFKDLGIAAH